MGRYISSDPIGIDGGAGTYSYATNSPLIYYDRMGLAADTISQRITVLLGRGDLNSLRNLVGGNGLTPVQKKLADEAIDKLESTAGSFISKYCRGSINREFPNKFREHTLEEIIKAARNGDRAAQKAKKLLNDNRFKK